MSMLRRDQIESLELLSKFVAETPKGDLQALIDQYSNLNIDGPTFAEYLVGLDNEMTLSSASSPFITFNDIKIYLKVKGSFWESFSDSPPERAKISYNKNPADCGVSFL